MPRHIAPFIAILPKFTILCLVIRLLFILWPQYEIFPFILDFINLVSIFVGGLGGIFESNILRIIAFSGIANIGLLLLPLQTGEIVAIHASLLFFIIYFITLFNLFSFLFAFTVKRTLLFDALSDLKFFSYSSPFIGILFAISQFSFAGLPPLAGWFPKLFAVLMLNESGHFLIAILLLCVSALSVFYYLDFIVNIFFSYKYAFVPCEPISSLSLILILTSSLLNVLFIAYLPLLNYWILIALLDLFDPWSQI